MGQFYFLQEGSMNHKKYEYLLEHSDENVRDKILVMYLDEIELGNIKQAEILQHANLMWVITIYL